MNQDEILNKKIGNIENEKLAEGKVTVVGVSIEPVVKKDTKVKIGDKVVFICKHPDREEPLKISKVKYVKGENIASSGIWYNEDKDGNIVKKSALADIMRFYRKEALSEFEGTEVQTKLDGEYLSIKAY